MLREEVKEIAQSLQHILGQAHFIPTLNKEVSLLAAAQAYNSKDPAASDLKKVMETLHEHPPVLEALLKELDILSHELEASL